MREERTAKQQEARAAKRLARKKAQEEAEGNAAMGPKKAKPSPAKIKSAERLAEIEAVQLPEGLKVYDDCDDVRKHMQAFFLTKECTQAALADHLGFSVGSVRKYHVMKGKRQGSGSIVYKNAYYFFEKLRILEGKAKAKKRPMFEESTPEGYELARDPSYRFLAPLLTSHGHTVYLSDLRGTGNSSADFASYSVEDVVGDVVDMVQRLVEPRFVLVGNSFTAACIVLLGQSAVASKIQATVLLGPFVRDPPGVGPKVFGAIAPVMFPRLYGAGMWTAYWQGLFQTPPSDFAEYKAYLKANLHEKGRLRALVKMVQASKARAGRALASFHLPLLIGMGVNDPDFASPAAEANFIHDAVQSSMKRVSMYPDTKHYPQVDCPDAVVADILQFLRDL
ncbi:hydrolase [Achlya hypogyna]|uniref:Hydrolase n=1 Tax=Achlya hypogyna TaxID=1202772 RepID=A0A1V9ZSV1_ACHHY|nr:hydrolase [Achlya hypogyna]